MDNIVVASLLLILVSWTVPPWVTRTLLKSLPSRGTVYARSTVRVWPPAIGGIVQVTGAARGFWAALQEAPAVPPAPV